MEKVKLYTGTQFNQSINLWGEVVTFDGEGVAEVTEEIAKKAASSIPADYSLSPTKRKVAKVSSFSHEPSADGVGKRAASVVEREHKAKLEAEKTSETEEEISEPVADEPKAKKSTKKTKKKSSSKSKEKTSEKTEEAQPEETTEIPPNDENPKNSEGDNPGDIWGS